MVNEISVVSMIGDVYRDQWKDRYPKNPPWNWEGLPSIPVEKPSDEIVSNNLKLEMEILRAEFEQLKKLLLAAKQYDEDNDEPDCEIDDKMEKLRKVAKLFNETLDDILGAEVNE